MGPQDLCRFFLGIRDDRARLVPDCVESPPAPMNALHRMACMPSRDRTYGSHTTFSTVPDVLNS